MRPTFALGGLALAVLVAGSGLALALRDDAPPTVQARLASAQRGQVTALVSAAGSTVDGSRRDLAFGSSGTVTKVYVKVGTKVKKGQVLARIDGRGAREAYEAAKADVAAAEEALEEASSAPSPAPSAGTPARAGRTPSACVPSEGGTPQGSTRPTPTGTRPAATTGTPTTRPTSSRTPDANATPTDGTTIGDDRLAGRGGSAANGEGSAANGAAVIGPASPRTASPVASAVAALAAASAVRPASSPSSEPTSASHPGPTPTSTPAPEPTDAWPQPTATVTVTATVTTTVTAAPTSGGTNVGDHRPSLDDPSSPSATGKPTGTAKPSARPSSGTNGDSRPSQNPCTPSGNVTGNGTRAETGTGAPARGGLSEDQAAANVDRARAALEQAADAVRATRIVAPRAGTILSVAGRVGDTAGTATFVSLGDLNELQVQAMVTESDVNHLKLGQKSQIILATRNGERHEATVTAIAPTATVDGRLVRYGVTLAFAEPPSDLMLGQTASVTVTTDEARDAVYVPAAAIRSRADGTQVVTVRSGGRDSAKVVRTGVRGDQYVEVKEGLSESDQVVISNGTAGEFPDGSWPDA
ncbi:efflux RND transporter periplasmic adaptor subunit [Nonomuraea sp. NPDC046802]|uniref:efflux RND transporter periplasmic adaptor subunit n=1 Tax=Nonomuraea sp. NPDC046802 TaxID=3154919 RepID=UPI0034046EE7